VAPALADRPTACLGGSVTADRAAASVLARIGYWDAVRRLEGFVPIRAAWAELGGALLGPDGHLLAA
jgi:hypothetical protein